MIRKLKTVAQFADDTPFTEAQIRWWIFNADTNGLAPAFVRVGRRVYIDTEAFDAWLDRGVQATCSEVAA
jgi:hypothetical protein